MKLLVFVAYLLLLSGCNSFGGNRFFNPDQRYVLVKNIVVENGKGAGVLPKGTVVYEYRSPAEGTSYFVLFNLNDSSAVMKLEPGEKINVSGTLEGSAK